jgi:hypothetical protein
MKRFIPFFVVCLALVVFVAPAFAKGPSAPAGNSNKAHLNLLQKDPVTWETVPDGAWGKMTYDLTGPTFNYVFNGHGLIAGTNYTLIYYPDPWPGTGLLCLGSGSTNGGGNVNISGTFPTGNLPTVSDATRNWNVVGTWQWSVLSTYLHDITITSQDADGNFVGVGGYPAGSSPYSQTEAITGQVVGNTIKINTVYNPGPYSVTATGTISSNGSISGADPWSWELTGRKATPSGGAKIWLVLSSDVNCTDTTGMASWNPKEYLFEEALVTFKKM